MNLDFQAGNSPLAARLNPAIYLVLLFFLIIALVIVAFFFILKLKKEQEKSPEWIEKQKKHKTTKKNVEIFAEKYKLNLQEKNILWKLCKKYKIPNILYALKDLSELEPFFLQYYKEEGNESPFDLNSMFKLKFRIDRILAASSIVKTTTSIPKDSRISEIFHDGTKIAFSVFENTKDFLSIKITKEFYESEKKPDNLEKVAFTFHSQTGMRYAFVSRIIRYEQKDDTYLMIVSHTNELMTKQQRHFKRLLVSEKCKIASVKIETNKKQEENYIPSETKYDCMLTNISGGGCCISTTLPIKEGQLTYVELTLGTDTHGLIGTIVKTRKSSAQGIFNLHINFNKVPLEIQNKILAKVYGYN